MRHLKGILCFLSLFSVFGLIFISPALPLTTASTFNNVQITVQTSSLEANYFVVNAYNMTGYLEASTQTHYPSASFELPSSQYIFTVTANNESYSVVPPVLTPSTPSTPSGGAASSTSTPSLPIYIAPAVEYGYSVQPVSSPINITIITQNVTSFPTNQISVSVLYSNGTAAADAYVSASVIGSAYYWGYEPNVVTWTTTGTDGTANLLTPIAPLTIDSWLWVPYNETSYPVPQSAASGQGQAVNGTIIPAPIYIGLAGSTTILPPQTNAVITLQLQQTDYWATPYTGTATPTGTTSTSYAAGPGSVPYSVYEQQQGNPNLQNLQPSSSPTPQPTATPSTTPVTPEFPSSTIFLIALFTSTSIALSMSIKNHSRSKHKPIQKS